MKFEIVLFYALALTSVAARHAIQPRQGNGGQTASVTISTPTNQAQSSSGTSKSIAVNSGPSAAAPSDSRDVSDASSQPTSTDRAISTTQIQPGSLASQTATSNATSSGDPHPLPVPPKITPGVGVAGAILMITGLIYGLIGIKNKMLYQFFGVAYLAALAVAVLIIYCMNPPVSDAVQGGFVVSCVFAGVLAGGCSLLFPDMIEGVGCLLGGFCLSMWFLCLKEGGLIETRTGKIIFIACMSVAAYSLSFSHYTRTYGLIICIPFSGATAAIIGIDCFSRAGLKEMWIYVWQINDDVFPLHTKTYPITRGIRVETAGVILLFLLGLVTHVRLQKIIKQRRAQKKSSRAQAEEELHREDTAVGQRIEENLGEERMRWESIYGGGKGVADSTVVGSTDSMTKTNSDKRLSSHQDFEMSQISFFDRHKRSSRRSSKQPKGATVTVTAAEEDGDEIQRDFGNNETDRANPKRDTLLSATSPHDARLTSAASNRSHTNPTTARPSAAPEVVPLPFRIPSLDMKVPKSEIGSLSAIEESLMNKRASERISGVSSTWHRMSGKSAINEVSASSEDLVFPHEDNRDSSVAATLDGLDEDEMSLSEVSLPRSPLARSFGPPSPRLSHQSFLDPASSAKLEEVESSSSDKIGDLLSAHGPKPEVPEKSARRISTSSDTRDAESLSISKRRSGVKSERSQSSAAGNSHKLVQEHLPDSMSKVVLQYRTNEWAKHLSAAEEPESISAARSSSPGIRVNTTFNGMASQEHTPISPLVHPDQFIQPMPAAKRLSGASTQQDTSKTAGGLQVNPTSLSRLSGTSSDPSTPHNQSSPQLSRASSSSNINPIANQSTTQINRVSSASNPRQFNIHRVSRNMSTPQLIRTGTEPIIEGSASQYPDKHRAEREANHKTAGTGKAPVPSETLLGQRESLVKNKPSTRSFAQSSTPNLVMTPPTEYGSGHIIDDDEIPLSQHRRSLMTSPKPKQPRQESWPPPSAHQTPPLNASTLTLGAFDSHQPQRQTSKLSQTQRESMLTSWRESLRAESQMAQQPGHSAQTADDSRRQWMLNEKRQKQMKEKQAQMKKTNREDAFDHAMRNGTMIDAHRKALKRMQSDAK